MRRLTIILAGADKERFRDALQVAAAWAALDRPARIFFQGEAVRLLTPALSAASDASNRQAGHPTLAELFEQGRALGVQLIACQGGLGLTAMRSDALPEGVEVGGLVSLLADGGEDQLLFA